MSPRPGLLARGPWRPDQVEAVWREDAYEPPAELDRMADAAVEGLRERGSPAHDGMSTRLVAFADAGTAASGWSSSRCAGRCGCSSDASDSLTALCVVRSEDGRWLAGRRADWVSSWAGRWALGAGGAVDLGESPAETLTRELQEEWRLAPRDLAIEALVCLPNGLTCWSAWPPSRTTASRCPTPSTTSGRGGRPDTGRLAARGGRPPQADGSTYWAADRRCPPIPQ